MWPTVQAALSRRRVEIALCVLLFFTYAYFYQSAQHNGAARFDQTRAIVEDGVLHIDRFRFNTADVIEVAREGGPTHIYPNKAPGTSLLAVPPFWFWMRALRLFDFREWVYWHVVAYATILSTIGLLSVVAAVAMYGILRRLTADPAFSALAVVAIWLGTICFPFSTLFFSHQQAAAQLALAFYFLFRLRHDGASAMRRPVAKSALAGLLCGFTLATEYPTILLVAPLCVYLAATLIRMPASWRFRLGLGAAFCGGLIGGGLVLVAYNLAVFGKVFDIPYRTYAQTAGESPFPGHRAGYVGVHWPGWGGWLNVLGEITVRPQRGLLYIGVKGWRVYACNPVLWLALPGLLLLFVARKTRAEAVLVAAMTVAYLAFNACFGDSIVYWGGAWSVGPRHLIPLLPFLALPLAQGARRLWWLFCPLLLVSIFYMLLATAVEPRVPYEYPNPARDLFLQKYLHGQLALNREGLFDPGSRPLTADSTAFNWAKLAGLPGTVQLVPLLLFWLVAGTALIWAASTGGQAARQTATEGEPQNAKRTTDNGQRTTDNEEEGRRGDRLAPKACPGNETLRPCHAMAPNEEGTAGPRRPLSAVFQPRFSPWVATVTLALFVGAIAAAPPIHHARLQRELATGGGLLGRYFANPSWQGQPAFVRKDPRINFKWTLDPPWVGRFSVEWLGTVRIDRPGRYLFATESDDGSSLYLGSSLVVDNGGPHDRRYASGQVEIKQAGVYPLRVRYFNGEGGGMIRVTWQPPDQREHLLPPEVLSPPGVEKEVP